MPSLYALKSLFSKKKTAINRFNSDMHHELKQIRASEARLKERLVAMGKELEATKVNQENYKIAIRKHAVTVVKRKIAEIEREAMLKWQRSDDKNLKIAS